MIKDNIFAKDANRLATLNRVKKVSCLLSDSCLQFLRVVTTSPLL